MTSPEEFYEQCVDILSQRGAVYSPDDDKPAHFQRIADVFTALIEAHYGMKLPHKLPGWMAANMNSATKLIRSCRSTAQPDTFLDLANYSFLALNALEAERESLVVKAETLLEENEKESNDPSVRFAPKKTVFAEIDRLIKDYEGAPLACAEVSLCVGVLNNLKRRLSKDKEEFSDRP